MTNLVTARDLANAPNIREMFADQARQRNRRRPKSAPRFRLAYQHPDLGDDDGAPAKDPHDGLHLQAVKAIAAALITEYPVHGKLVALEATGGILMIELPPLIVRPACGIVNLVKTPTYQWGKTAVRVFGEMLERLRLSRQRFDESDFMTAIGRRTARDHRYGIVPE
jgi:hypothetical protein